ncbi:MAG: hypothetical protein C0485_11805 [Pirellula sp.]|nr:hypothetical protein [Pirellula sp.]
MKWIFAAVVAITLAVVGYYATTEAVAALLFGWLSFFARVIPQVRVYWPSVILGLTAFVMFTVGLHWFLTHLLSPSTARSNSEPASQRWRFRWTAAAVSMVIVAFAAGISLVGVVHQVGWLANSQEPLLGEALEYSRVGEVRNNLKEISLGIDNAESARDRYPTSALLSPEGQPLHGWETQILPYIGIMTRDIDMTRPWNDSANQKYFKCVIPCFINPEFRTPELEDAEGYGLNHFSANSRVFTADKSMHGAIKDGAAKTPPARKKRTC